MKRCTQVQKYVTGKNIKQIVLLIVEENFKIELLVFHLSLYAAAQLLPKNRPAGWEPSLSW